MKYRQICNISHIKSKNLNVSCLNKFIDELCFSFMLPYNFVISAELWCLLCCELEQTAEETANMPVSL